MSGRQTMTRDDIVAKNLGVVDAHFAHENPEEIEKAVALYMDDIVPEVPSRRRLLRNREEVANEYRGLFAATEQDSIGLWSTSSPQRIGWSQTSSCGSV